MLAVGNWPECDIYAWIRTLQGIFFGLYLSQMKCGSFSHWSDGSIIPLRSPLTTLGGENDERIQNIGKKQKIVEPILHKCIFHDFKVKIMNLLLFIYLVC